MTDLELLECTQSVYDFLIDDTDSRLNQQNHIIFIEQF
jgi:hypothetical protein